ncbi:MAG TPA: DNA-binding response regulator [Firmicutes bacterium]|nr:DNA-binding response regulator [Bacillota bacterium]
MLTILVVDDEYLVRKGIRETIAWENYGFTIIGEAGNGKEALQLAITHHPDIIITDIRMPFMDGLEFMAKLKEAGLDSRIIVLSGYGEFDYARAAIENGAVSYLLKPVENENLIETITKVGEKIISDRNTLEYYQQLQIELPAIKKQFLLDLINGDITAIDDIQAKLTLLQLPLVVSGTNLTVIIKLDDFKIIAQQLPTQTLEQLREIIFYHANQCLGLDGKGFQGFIFEKNPGEWVLIAQTSCTADPVALLKENCKTLFMKLKDIARPELSNITISIGISNPHPAITEISRSYDEAISAAGCKFLPGNNSVVTFADNGVADCHTEIKKAIAYIRTHYAENITAETAARELFISPSYLMHLFKAELGKTFNDSLVDCRIEMAKELLQNPQYRIYEVCQKVGYTDTKYFSQLFKKITGMSPKEYVKKIS